MRPIPLAENTNPLASGKSTSEFKFSVAVAISGAVLAGATTMFGVLQESFPHIGWIGVAAGVLAKLGALYAYVKGRATVKAAIIDAGAVTLGKTPSANP